MAAIHSKKHTAEEMEKKLETLKRVVEENKLEEIEDVLNKGQEIYLLLHEEFEDSVKEVFDLQKKEQELLLELREVDKEVQDLSMEKMLFKADTKVEKKKTGKSRTDAHIRRKNREKNEEKLRPENLPLDQEEFQKWSGKIQNVDAQLEKYLGVYLELAGVTHFDPNQFELQSRVQNEVEPGALEMIQEKKLVSKSEEEIQSKVQSIENWLNMLIMIQKRNLVGERNQIRLEINAQASPEKKKKGTRRASRIASNRRSFLLTQSIPRKVGLTSPKRICTSRA